MSRKWKKAAAFLLSLAMVLSMMTGIVFADDGNDREAIEEYQFEPNVNILPGWSVQVGGLGNVYVEDSEHPDGADLIYHVTDVKILKDPEGIFAGAPEKHYENDDPQSENFWWEIRTNQRILGKGVIEISYLDLKGNIKSYQREISAQEGILYASIFGEEGFDITFPGKNFGLMAIVSGESINLETGEREGIDPSQVRLEWYVEGGEEWTTLTPDSQGRYLLPSEGNMTTVPVRAFKDDEKDSWADIEIGLNLYYDGNEPIGHEHFTLHVCEHYTQVWPTFVEYNTRPGETVSIKPEIRVYDIDLPEDKPYTTVEGVSFAAENYSDSDLQIVKEQDGSFTIKRLSPYRSYFELTGMWEDTDGTSLWKSRSYEFGDFWANIRLEDEGSNLLYNDGKLKLFLDTEEIKRMLPLGTDFEIAYTVGVRDGDEWKIKIDPAAYAITQDGILIDGTKISKPEEGGFEVFAEAKVGGVTVAETSYWVEMREAFVNYEMEHDREILPGWDWMVRKDYHVRVENAENPYGVDLRYNVTNVEVVDGRELLSDFHKMNDESGGYSGWYCRFKDDALGTVTLKVTYLDIDGKEQSYTFDLISKGTIYDISLETDNGSTAGLPGASRNFIAKVVQHSYDKDTKKYSDQDVTPDVAYVWELGDQGPEFAELLYDESNVAKLTVLPQNEWFWEDFPIRVTGKYGSEDVGSAELWFTAADGYYELWPQKIEQLKPGESMTITAEERLYSMEFEEEYRGVDDVHFRWEYDPEAIEITDKDGTVVGNYKENGEYNDSAASTGTQAEFTIRRLNNWASDFRLIAEWEMERDEPDGTIHKEWTEDEVLFLFESVKEEADDFLFDDVQDPSAWYFGYVYDAYNYKNANDTRLMSGYGGGKLFGPTDPLARSQFAVMLHRLDNEPEVAFDPTAFKDIPTPGNFYDTACMWAKNAKVITGYDNGYFGVSDPINREQLATILYRYAKDYKHLDVADAYKKGDISGFSDSKSVSSFAQDALKWANGAGIITGKADGRIDPQGQAVRAEVAAMFMRYVGYISTLSQ